MGGSVRLCEGDLFSSPADMVVLPVSTAGTITSGVRRKLEAFSLPSPPSRLQLGDINVQALVEAEHIASYVAYAASVQGHYSTSDAIALIGEKLGNSCRENETIRNISSPLLGTGSGGLEYSESFEALTDGFRSSAPHNAVLSIYALQNDVFRILKGSEPEDQILARISDRPERIFISYAHSSEAHKRWVKGLATALRANGFEARLDAWHLKPGANMPQWMSTELDLADRCVLVCDEKYAQKADGHHGGVGWEYRLIEGNIFRNQATANSRFIPVVTSKTISLPIALQDCLAVHCPRDDDADDETNALLWAAVLDALKGGEAAPPVLQR